MKGHDNVICNDWPWLINAMILLFAHCNLKYKDPVKKRDRWALPQNASAWLNSMVVNNGLDGTELDDRLQNGAVVGMGLCKRPYHLHPGCH